MAEWKRLTDGTFKSLTFHVAVPTKDLGHGITRQEIETERRLQIAYRPLVNGASVSDFGRNARPITVDIVFHGPNYQDDFEKFRAVCEEGTEGILTLPVLPVSVKAMFHKMTERSEYTSDNSIVAGVTWIESSSEKTPLLDPTGALVTTKKSITDTAAKVKVATAAAQAAVKGNSFLSAVRDAEAGISKVRSAVNTVLTLEQGARARVIQVQANIQSTLSLIDKAVDETSSLLGAKKSSNTSTFSASIDNVTGQRVASAAESDALPVTANPLTAPATPAEPVSTPAVQSPASAGLAIDTLTTHLNNNNDELETNGRGATDDISAALVNVNTALRDFNDAFAGAGTKFVLVPIEMSLAEVCFLNGKSIDDVETVLLANTQIEDPLVVSAGEVVSL